jgi:protein-S-isoprenylcysteine O-methyltransferase Ste14
LINQLKKNSMALQEEFELQGNYLFRYRGVLPLAILLTGLFAYILHITSLPENRREITDGFYSYFCLFITLLGFTIRIYTVGYSPDNTSGRNTKEQVADELNTTGIYSIVRHPLYVGNLLMWSGFALLSQNLWFMLAFIFVYWVYYERIMFAEEQFLRKKFGVVFLRWAKKTPAFIPQLTNFKKPDTPFKISKVIKQEKTGFALVFLLYFLFHQIGLSILQKNVSIHFNFWFYAMIFSLALYIIIKILEKNSKAEPDTNGARVFTIDSISNDAS